MQAHGQQMTLSPENCSITIQPPLFLPASHQHVRIVPLRHLRRTFRNPFRFTLSPPTIRDPYGADHRTYLPLSSNTLPPSLTRKLHLKDTALYNLAVLRRLMNIIGRRNSIVKLSRSARW